MLSPEDTERFRVRLEQIHTDLSERLRDLEQMLVFNDDDSDSGFGNHPAEVGTLLFMQEQSAGMIEHTRANITQVEHALNRIAEGTYGISEISGQPIPIERLEALPYATTLVDEEPRTREVGGRG